MMWFKLDKISNVIENTLEYLRRLIDSFVNSIYLFDDRLEFNMNYKDGTKVITFGKVMDFPLGSDLTALAASSPNNEIYLIHIR